MRRLCVGKPPDWWETADEGARLALMLCSVCPARAGCDTGEEFGVIRGGVAYLEDGTPAQMCPCGRPVARWRPVAECFTCSPEGKCPIPAGRRRRRVGECTEEISRMWAEGMSYAQIGEALGGVAKSSVRNVVKRQLGSVGVVVAKGDAA